MKIFYNNSHARTEKPRAVAILQGALALLLLIQLPAISILVLVAYVFGTDIDEGGLHAALVITFIGLVGAVGLMPFWLLYASDMPRDGAVLRLRVLLGIELILCLVAYAVFGNLVGAFSAGLLALVTIILVILSFLLLFRDDVWLFLEAT